MNVRFIPLIDRIRLFIIYVKTYIEILNHTLKKRKI